MGVHPRSIAVTLGVLAVAVTTPAPHAGAAPVGTQDVDCPGGNNAGFVSFHGGGGGWAQTFTPSKSGKLLYAEVRRISRVAGGTGGDITVDVRPTSAGVPTGPVLATSSIPGASITADNVARDYPVTFPAATAAFLNAGTTYALGLRTADSAQNAWSVHTDTCGGTVYISTAPDTFGLFAFTSGEDAGHTTYMGPENDDYSRALTLTGTSDSHDGTTAGATREPDEPDHYITNPPDSDFWIGDHSVWYSWVAPHSGPVTLDVCTALIDSILAVYVGEASTPLAGLSRVADNNNDAACPAGTFGSYLTFNATAGVEYRFAIGDAGGARENTFTLDLASNEPPVVTPLKPAPGAVIRQRRPRIKATVTDALTDLAAGDIDLYLDGRARTNFTYDQATDTVSFRKRLAPRKHTVRVDGTDAGGATGTATWKFRIKR